MISGLISEIPADSMSTITAQLSGVVGPNIYVFKLNPMLTLPESDYSNNVLTKTITITAERPDLALSGFKLEPTRPILGDPVSISVDVSNLGTVNSRNVNVLLKVIGHGDAYPTGKTLYYDAVWLDPIPKSGSKHVTFAGRLAAVNLGNNPKLEIIIEVYNQRCIWPEVCDSNEITLTNNRIEEHISPILPFGPDLVIQTNDITLLPPSPTDGEDIKITATVRNIGSDPVGQFAAKISIDGILSRTIAVNGLAAGTSKAIDTIFTGTELWQAGIHDGTHTVAVKVDDNNEIDELRENNNYAERSFTIGTIKKCDLALVDIAINPVPPRYLQDFSITARIKNLGDDCSLPFYAELELDTQTHTKSIPQIASGSMKDIVFDVKGRQTGTYTASVTIKPLERDADSSNNIGTKDFSIIYPDRMAELTIDSIVIVPKPGTSSSTTTPAPYKPFTIAITVYNDGEISADPFNTLLEIHKIKNYGYANAQDVIVKEFLQPSEGLTPGSSRVVEVDVAEGLPRDLSYYAKAIVDVNNSVPERNETNIAKKHFTVTTYGGGGGWSGGGGQPQPHPPVITIVSPLDKTYSSSSVWANVTVNEPVSWCAVSLDSGKQTYMEKANTYNYYKLLSGLTDGAHYVNFTCFDGYYEGKASRQFKVQTGAADTTPPVINKIYNTTPVFAGMSATFEINVTDDTGVKLVQIDSTQAVNVSQDTWKIDLAVPAYDGIHKWTVMAMDFAGNKAYDNITIIVNLSASPNATIDYGAPKISAIRPTTAAPGTVTLYADVTDDAGVKSCTLYIDGKTASMSDSLPSKSTTVSATQTLSSGTYIAYAACYDILDNFGVGPNTTITVSAPSPGAGPGPGPGAGAGAAYYPAPRANLSIMLFSPIVLDIGETGSFAVKVHNTGPDELENIKLDVSGIDFDIKIEPETATLAAGDSMTYTVSVTVPATAKPTKRDITITATANGLSETATAELYLKQPGAAPPTVTMPLPEEEKAAPTGIAGALIAIAGNPAAVLGIIALILGIFGWLYYRKLWIFKPKAAEPIQKHAEAA
jgi:subtilase family serine protease